MQFQRLLSTLAAAASLLAATAASAQGNYPTKPIQLIVPFATGGPTDILARVLATDMSPRLGQPIVVEAKAGATGSIGQDYVSKSAPDGYTIVMITNTSSNNYHLMNRSIDFVKDFSMIINLVTVPNVMTVNPKNVPVKDMKEFIALVKKSPGKYSFASSGTGGISHLDGELFKALTGTFIVHIPYRGSGPALNDAIAGQVDIQMDNLPSSIPHIKAGRLHALAVMSDKRIPDLPDVPTFAEVGLKEANNVAWYGLVGPAGLAPEIVTKVNTAANAALKDPQVIARFAEGGSIAAGGTPQQFAQNAARELALRRDIVKKQKITLD